MDPAPVGLVSVFKRETWRRSQARKEDEKTQGEDGVCKPRGQAWNRSSPQGPPREPTLPAPRSWTPPLELGDKTPLWFAPTPSWGALSPATSADKAPEPTYARPTALGRIFSRYPSDTCKFHASRQDISTRGKLPHR